MSFDSCELSVSAHLSLHSLNLIRCSFRCFVKKISVLRRRIRPQRNTPSLKKQIAQHIRNNRNRCTPFEQGHALGVSSHCDEIMHHATKYTILFFCQDASLNFVQMRHYSFDTSPRLLLLGAVPIILSVELSSGRCVKMMNKNNCCDLRQMHLSS